MNRHLPLLLVLCCVTRAVVAVEIIAHRGASHDAPENTVAAFRLGWQQNADANELDIHLSKDGQIVVIHDKTTKRTTGMNRAVVEQTLAELRQQDAGTWKESRWSAERIPTLAEALETMPDGKRTFIEIKCGPEAIPELARVLANSGKKDEQLVIIGFGYETMAAAKKRFPGLHIYWVVDYKGASEDDAPPTIDELVRKATLAGFDGLDLNWRFPLDAAAVAKVKQQGLKLVVWTVNDADVAARLAGAGVDGITTDRPQWLREQLAQAAIAQPAGRVDDPWRKHVVFAGGGNMTVVGADFTGDRKIDVISTFGGAARSVYRARLEGDADLSGADAQLDGHS